MSTNTHMSATDKSLIEKVVWLYYRENMNNQEISANLGISRFKVARLLDEAIKRNIVNIEIRIPDENILATQIEIEKKYHLKEVLIARSLNPQTPQSSLGEIGANYFQRILKPNLTIGVGISNTINTMLDYLPDIDCVDCKILQITGGVAGNDSESMALINLPTRLAKKINSPVLYLFAPVVVNNAATRKAILEESAIKEGFQKFKQIDVAFVGIGDLDDECTLCRLDVINTELLDNLKARGAVGDINARFYDSQGNSIWTEIDDRLIGIDFESLKGIKRVVAIAGGEKKHKAILGALKGKFVDVLITDLETAEYLNTQN